MVRPLNLPNHKDTQGDTTPPVDSSNKHPRPLKLSNIPIPTPAPVEEPKKTKALNVGTWVKPDRVVKRTEIDDYIDKALQIDSKILPLDIRAKITAAMTKTMEGLLTWGDHNLVHIQAASNVQTQIAMRMSQINAAGWLKDTMEASCKKPSMFGNMFSAPASPEYYEGMLRKTQAELLKLVSEVSIIEKNYAPEIKDLHLDGVSLMVVIDKIVDAADQMVANNRVRSIMAAHQTGVMLLETMKQIKIQSADYIQRIDDLLTTTIPNWKLAYKSR